MIRTRALASACGRLEQRHDAVGPTAITAVVVAARDARRDRSVDELLPGAQHRRTHRHAERARRVVRVGVNDDIAARREAFALLEIRKHLVVAPAGRATAGPGIEVSGMTAHVCHVVDTRRAAEHLAAWHHHPALVEPEPTTASIGGVHPVDVRVLLQHRARDRHRFGGRRRPAGLEQRDPDARVLRQARSDNCTRRTTTHHDKIKLLHHESEPTHGCRMVAITTPPTPASDTPRSSVPRSANPLRYRSPGVRGPGVLGYLATADGRRAFRVSGVAGSADGV